MTAAGRYLLGLAATAAGAALATGAARADIRAEIAWGALTGLVLQAPLGWWVVQSIGTERFVLIVTSQSADFLPSSYAAYAPSVVDVGVLVGTLAFFAFLFLLFLRFVPFSPVSELMALKYELGEP